MKGDCKEINKAISSYHDCAPGDHSEWKCLFGGTVVEREGWNERKKRWL